MKFEEAKEFALKPDWDRENVARREPSRKKGPSEWATIEPSDFGPEWDYLTVPLTEDRTAIVCKSKAGLEWCREKLPPDIDRYSTNGFVIENTYLGFIEQCMDEAGLMSHSCYVNSMEEMNELARQWGIKTVCNFCGEEAVNLPPGIFYCWTCERVVEGNTHEEEDDEG